MRVRLLALLLLASRAALAHPAPDASSPPDPPPEIPSSPAREASPPPAPATTPAPARPPPRSRPERAFSPLRRIPRITAELVLGGASAAGMAYGGYQLGCALSGSSLTSTSCAEPGLYGGMAGLALGVPIGVMLGGALMDGDGGFAPTAFGATFGLAAMVGGLVFIQRNAPGMDPLPLLALPLVFAVVGYELSSHDSRTAAQAEARGKRTALWIVPSAAVIDGGLALGVLVPLP